MPKNNNQQVPVQNPTQQPAATPRVPQPVYGIQVNHCKNPNCENFEVPVPNASTYGDNPYTIVATGAKLPAARCNSCKETFGLKSNQGVFEEAYRVLAETYGTASCPNAECSNHRVTTFVKGAYQSFGKTSAGACRFMCNACKKTFSVKPKDRNPIALQKQSDKNRMILSMLVNKMPMRRICEAADVHPQVLYNRIDFLHGQAVAFLSERERRIPDIEISRLYIGVDRQDQLINWSRRKDKRNVTISSAAAADNETGYVFAMLPNFDPEPDPSAVEAEHRALGDDKTGACFRRHARLWLRQDYDAAVAASQKVAGKGTLPSEIAASYATAETRPDVESSEFVVKEDMLPERGMLVHSEYSLYGFFVALNKLFANVEKVRFFLDQDSGMRAACLSAFRGRISEGSCDAFYVRISKDMTIDEKQKILRKAEAEFAMEAEANPKLDEKAVKLLMLKNRIAAAQTIGPWKDRWVFHPLPNISEPEKALCHLTDLGNYDPDHLAWLYNKASLHAVDSFFNRIRRRSSMLERPIHSSAQRGRIWNAYRPYVPEQISKMQTIIRACHNYVWMGEGKKAARGTPATRLGLAKAPLDLNDIIYFK